MYHDDNTEYIDNALKMAKRSTERPSTTCVGGNPLSFNFVNIAIMIGASEWFSKETQTRLLNKDLIL